MDKQVIIPNANIYHILMVDDKIDALDDYIKGMRKVGLKVSTATSPGDAKLLVKENRDIDIIITDMLMPGGNGIDLIREIREELPSITSYVLSSYTNIEELQDDFYRNRENISVISKNSLPAWNSDEYFQKFLPGLIEGPTGLATYIGGEHSVKKFLDITFDEYLEYSEEQRIALNEAVRRAHSEEIGKLFSQGNLWVLLCGSGDSAVTAEETREIWSEQEVIEYARKKNAAPYQFMSEFDVEDLGWGTGCSNSNGTQNYPTVTFEIEEITITAHFDTGNPITFFDKDMLIQQNLASVNFSLPLSGSTRKGGDYSGSEFRRTDAFIIDQITRESISLDLLYGIAVNDWKSQIFSRECQRDCENRTSTELYCKFRTALVGRNILTDNKLKVILDGKRMKTLLNER